MKRIQIIILILITISCNNRTPYDSELLGFVGISEESFITKDNIYPELAIMSIINVSNYNDLDYKMNFHSPLKVDCDTKVFEESKGKWDMRWMCFNEDNSNPKEYRRISKIKSFKRIDSILNLQINEEITLKYVQIDSFHNRSLDSLVLDNKSYFMRSSFLNGEVLEIKFNEKRSREEYDYELYTSKGERILNSKGYLSIRKGYSSLLLKDIEEIIGIPFWGFFYSKEPNKFELKVRNNNKWEFFMFELKGNN